MGILSRCRDILDSNVNALLDKVEDPAKLVDQYLINAKRDLAECKKETAGVMAAEKQAQRAYEDCKNDIDKYMNAARNAVKAGNNDDARRLLESKQRLEAQLPQLEKNYQAAAKSSADIRDVYNKLVSDINDLEARKNTVKGTVAVAKAQEAINRAGKHSSYGAAASEGMSRLEAKANDRLDRASAAAELDAADSSDADLLNRYSSGGTSAVDDELAALMAEVNGNQE